MLQRLVRSRARRDKGRNRCQAMLMRRMDRRPCRGRLGALTPAGLPLLHLLQNLLAAMVALGLGEQSLLTHAAQAAQAVFDRHGLRGGRNARWR